MNLSTIPQKKSGVATLYWRATAIALIYILAAWLWIWVADNVLVHLLTNPNHLSFFQSYQGLFFVLFSGLLFWFERYWSDRRVAEVEERLHEQMTARTSELERLRQQLDILLDNAPVAFAMRGVDNRYILINRRWAEFAGVGQKDALGKTPYEIFSPEVARELTEALDRVWDKPEGIMEEVALQIGGRDYFFMRASFPLFDENQKPYAALGLVTDISDRKRFEESLRLAEERFRIIFSTVGVGINVLDINGHYVTTNPAFQKMLGYSEKELLGKHYWDFTYEPDFLKDEEAKARLAQNPDQIVRFEKRYVRADSSLVWARIVVSNIYGKEGKPINQVVVVEDISTLKEMEAEQQRTQEELERLVAQRTAELQHANDELAEAQRVAHLGNWNIDLKTNHLVWSAETYRIFGYEPDDFIGSREKFLERVHEEDRAYVTQVREETLRGQPMDYEHRVVRPNGEVRVVHERGYLVRDENGEPVRIFGTVQDITERKQAEAEVYRLNQELEERVAERTAHLKTEIAERLRAETEVKELNRTLAEQAEHLVAVNKELETFTYSVSHDLKAPLRGIDGYSRLLLEDYADRLDDEGRYFLDTIRNASTQMAQLIDDLLSYSRWERRTFSVSQTDVQALVESILVQLQIAHLYPQTVVQVAVEPEIIHIDADALAMILRNLIDNALKFSANGSAPFVEIIGERLADRYRLRVRDNGVGFDMQYQERIFETFQRLHRAEDYPGTGIGLAMVRKALSRMDGTIEVESQPEQGTTFTMEIPTV